MNGIMIKRLFAIIMALLILFARKSLKNGNAVKYRVLINLSTIVFMVGAFVLLIYKIVHLIN